MHSVEKYVSFLKYAYLPLASFNQGGVDLDVHDDFLFVCVFKGLGSFNIILTLSSCDRCTSTQSSYIATHDSGQHCPVARGLCKV